MWSIYCDLFRSDRLFRPVKIVTGVENSEQKWNEKIAWRPFQLSVEWDYHYYSIKIHLTQLHEYNGLGHCQIDRQRRRE